MIDYDRTLSVLGVDINELSLGRSTKVFAVCEECGKYRSIAFRQYRDLCHKCKANSPDTRKKNSAAHKGWKPTTMELFKQIKRNVNAMVENDYRLDVKYDPLGIREFYIVDRTGKIVG